MPDTVIARVNTLDGDQPKWLNFTDRHSRLIRDVETPRVGSESEDKNPCPEEIKQTEIEP